MRTLYVTIFAGVVFGIFLSSVSFAQKGAAERWGPSGISYYEWVNNQLKQVHFVPAGSYPERDP